MTEPQYRPGGHIPVGLLDEPIITEQDGVRVALLLGYPRSAQEIEAWCAWARKHGLDPELVMTDEPLVVDTRARTITYTHAELDSVTPGQQERRTVQLEAPALPFPSEETR